MMAVSGECKHSFPIVLALMFLVPKVAIRARMKGTVPLGIPKGDACY